MSPEPAANPTTTLAEVIAGTPTRTPLFPASNYLERFTSDVLPDRAYRMAREELAEAIITAITATTPEGAALRASLGLTTS